MPYACIATRFDRNFSIIEGVAQSQTNRSSSTAKRAMQCVSDLDAGQPYDTAIQIYS